MTPNVYTDVNVYKIVNSLPAAGATSTRRRVSSNHTELIPFGMKIRNPVASTPEKRTSY